MWRILNGPSFSCYRTVCNVAVRRMKQNPEWPPLVQFLGLKPSWPNSDETKLDFYVRPPHGAKDFSVDPTWAGNPKPC